MAILYTALFIGEVHSVKKGIKYKKAIFFVRKLPLSK